MRRLGSKKSAALPELHSFPESAYRLALSQTNHKRKLLRHTGRTGGAPMQQAFMNDGTNSNERIEALRKRE